MMSLITSKQLSPDQTELFDAAGSLTTFRSAIVRLRVILILLTLTLASLIVSFGLYARHSSGRDIIAKVNLVYNSKVVLYTSQELDLERSADHIRKAVWSREFKKEDLIRNFKIRPNGSDVFVQLRIQKTGSTTFRNHLAYEIDFEHLCMCKTSTKECQCPENLVFPPAETGWWCGLHADWTYLEECLPKEVKTKYPSISNQRFFILTMLREPVNRYISEWLHVRRGATWADAVTRCNNIDAKITPCDFGPSPKNLSLAEFTKCPSNLAHNRQTRMLADLTLVNCYNTSGMSHEDRHLRMLESAQKNLKSMAYFGLTEYQKYSQMLFEHTFGVKFKGDFRYARHVHADKNPVSPNVENHLKEVNKYDLALYHYAKHLFFGRLRQLLNRTIITDDYAARSYI